MMAPSSGTAEKKMSRRRAWLSRLAIVLIVVATVSVYYQLSRHTFLTLDDPLYVTGNDRVKSGLTPANIAWALTTFKGEFWHPLTWLSFLMDTEIYGVRAGGYLFTNLVLHLLNSLLVFFLFRDLSGRIWAGFMTGLLFAVHPLHVEAVAWISERKELLSAFFWLLALVSYGYYARNSGRPRLMLLVTACFALGLLAKTMIVTLPFVLLLLDYWPLGRDRTAGSGNGLIRRWWPLVREKIPLFCLAAAGSIVTLVAQHQGGGLVSLASAPWPERLANALTAYGLYLKKAFWPVDLSVFYPVSGQPVNALELTMVAALLVLVSAAVVYFSKKRRYLLFGWLWFLGTLVPVIGIVKIGDFFMADRYMYMPLLGLLVMAVFGLRDLLAVSGGRAARLGLAVVPVLLVGAYWPLAHSQVAVWRDSRALYNHALAVNPDDFLAHHALGNLLAGQNNMPAAIFHFTRAASLRPDKAVLWATLGRARAAAGQWPEAAVQFQKVRELAPEHPAAWFYLAGTAAARQDFEKAARSLKRCLAVENRPGRAGVDFYPLVSEYYRKGQVAQKKGQNEKARDYYQQALTKGGLDLTGNGLRRQVAGGYDQWLAGRNAARKSQ